MLSKHTIVITALLLASISINAQEEKTSIPMVTDRPDAVEYKNQKLLISTGISFRLPQ